MQEIDASHSPEFDNHKKVFRFEDPKVGLCGFIAIHNDNIGPTAGGTRMYPYESENEALDDVLRLSRAMTYKCALAGVKHGGGKGVIIGDPNKIKSDQLLLAYAKKVNSLKGLFITGEDSGINEEDVQLMLKDSHFFVGESNKAGDPSPYAALSTLYAMQAVLEEHYGIESLVGKRIAIRGVGKVGGTLAQLLAGQEALVVVADIDAEAIKNIKERVPGVKVAAPRKIRRESVDIYAPCALGGEFSRISVAEVSASIICGAANNQLATPDVGEELFRRGISYVPDYVANAGGLINVVDELSTGGYNQQRVLEKIAQIEKTVKNIFHISKRKNISPNKVADELAERIFLEEKS